MGEKEWKAETIFDLFGDTLARSILLIASQKRVSADELADHLDTSLPTIYRRVNTLREYDLIEEETQIADDGNHFKTFETALKRIEFELEAGDFDVNIEFRQGLVDQFEAFWADLDQSSPEVELDPSRSIDRSSTRSEGHDG